MSKREKGSHYSTFGPPLEILRETGTNVSLRKRPRAFGAFSPGPASSDPQFFIISSGNMICSGSQDEHRPGFSRHRWCIDSSCQSISWLNRMGSRAPQTVWVANVALGSGLGQSGYSNSQAVRLLTSKILVLYLSTWVAGFPFFVFFPFFLLVGLLQCAPASFGSVRKARKTYMNI